MMPPDERGHEWLDRHMYGGRDDYRQCYLFGDIRERVVKERSDNARYPDDD
jgi:hypothetical protein